MVAPPRQETVDTTARDFVSYNGNRTALTFVNLGSATVYWGLNSELTTSNGFPVASGQSNTFSKENGENPKLKRWFIGSGSDTLAITEGFGEEVEK